jgi:hypothetical protein
MVLFTYLADELVAKIMTYEPNKIKISMVCKLWHQILVKNINSLCYLQEHYNCDNISQLSSHIKFIVNHNCLNFIFEKISNINPTVISWNIINKKTLYKLLEQYCVTNNISNPKYLCTLLKYVKNDFGRTGLVLLFGKYNKGMLDILHLTRVNKSYDILAFLLLDSNIKDEYCSTLLDDVYFDSLIPEIDFLVGKQIYPLTDAYINIHKKIKKDNEFDKMCKLYGGITLQNTIDENKGYTFLKLLEKYMDKNMIEYINTVFT